MAEHQHEWRQHCPKRVCGWRKCSRCPAIQDLNTGHVIHAGKPPLKRDGK